jgi:hypothetical protein
MEDDTGRALKVGISILLCGRGTQYWIYGDTSSHNEHVLLYSFAVQIHLVGSKASRATYANEPFFEGEQQQEWNPDCDAYNMLKARCGFRHIKFSR